MTLVEGWYPPTRENWELIVYCWQFFPVFAAIQWFTTWYPAGKTSIESRFNIPGKWAWFFMECPGFLTVLYCFTTIPEQEGMKDIPWPNYVMVGIYTLHYLYRAILAPLFLNPTMSPIHLVVAASAFCWQIINGLAIGGWVSGYGPSTFFQWPASEFQICIGLVIWTYGFIMNVFHDEELRDIRREALREQKTAAKKDGKPVAGVAKVYKVPENALFEFALFAHYFCEWVEWTGFWVMAGWTCVPARTFLFNEIATMLPRALQGKQWYIEKFGKEKIGDRKAVIPMII